MLMDITSLSIECHADGTSKVSCWAKATTLEEIDDLIAFLQMARKLMDGWSIVRQPPAGARRENVTPLKKRKGLPMKKANDTFTPDIDPSL